MGVKVDKARASTLTGVPPHLNVRDLHGIADGLDVVTGNIRVWSKNPSYAAAHHFAYCNKQSTVHYSFVTKLDKCNRR